MNTVTVGMIKVIPEKWQPEANMAALGHLIPRVADAGADLVITPESFVDGYVVHEEDWTEERFAQVCEPGPDGRRATRLREVAAECGVWLVAGLSERRADGFYNTAHLIAPDGRLVGRYDKVQAHERYRHGTSLPVFETDFGTVAIAICADRRWPEIIRSLRLMGARIILMPTYGMKGPRNALWLRTRSYENTCWICFTHPEESLVTNPEGDIFAHLVGASPFLLCTIDLSEADDAPMLDERHPDVYGFAWELRN
ncbi:MAG: carbon-nitrogen hydrolase family protein [Armatimonadota bacterium]|nr:carbon-nitrogen hydrolase family protein [Armatimonadota bacterium]